MKEYDENGEEKKPLSAVEKFYKSLDKDKKSAKARTPLRRPPHRYLPRSRMASSRRSAAPATPSLP